MESGPDEGDEPDTLIDRSSIIRLVIQFVGAPPPDGEDAGQPPQAAPDADDDAPARDGPRARAGCMLWDLAATRCHAETLLAVRFGDVGAEVIAEALAAERAASPPPSRGEPPQRLGEIACGALAASAAHGGAIRRALAESPAAAAAAGAFVEVADAPMAREAARLLAAVAVTVAGRGRDDDDRDGDGGDAEASSDGEPPRAAKRLKTADESSSRDAAVHPAFSKEVRAHVLFCAENALDAGLLAHALLLGRVHAGVDLASGGERGGDDGADALARAAAALVCDAERADDLARANAHGRSGLEHALRLLAELGPPRGADGANAALEPPPGDDDDEFDGPPRAQTLLATLRRMAADRLDCTEAVRGAATAALDAYH